MLNYNKHSIFFYLSILAISIFIGLLGAVTSTIFLNSLSFVTNYRLQNSGIVYLLPFSGLLLIFLYQFFKEPLDSGVKSITVILQRPSQRALNFSMGPLILVSTLMTHLFGGSAGREGTALQMPAALVDFVFIKVRKHWSDQERSLVLQAALAAGFSSAVGVPWAGAIFAWELRQKSLKNFFITIPVTLVSSWTAYLGSIFLGIEHLHYPVVEFSFWHYNGATLLVIILVLSISGGLLTRLFLHLHHKMNQLFQNQFQSPYVRIFVGGILILSSYYIIALFMGKSFEEIVQKYAGLGLATIKESFYKPFSQDFITAMTAPLLKLFLTALTLAVGFRGGEFIPLLFIGSTLGVACAYLTPLAHELMPALALVIIFAAASKTPWASTIMAMELFKSLSLGPIVFVISILALFMAHKGHSLGGIYSPVLTRKPV